MQSQNEPTARKSLPAWFSAVAWSFIGIFAAILTICVLSVSLLWLLRWTNQASQLTDLTPVAPVTRTASGTPGSAGSISTPFSGTPGLDEGDSSRNQGDSSTVAASSATAEAGGLDTTPGTSPGTVSAAEQASATSSALETASAQLSQSQTPGAASASTSSAGLPLADLTATAGFNSTPELPEFTSTATAGPTPSRTASATAGATDTPTSTRTPTTTATATRTPTPTPTPTPEPQTYIVQTDDWLSKLSDKFYGDVLAYPAIVAATNAKATEDGSFTVIDDPDIIEVGQKLWLPTLAEVEILLEAEE